MREGVIFPSALQQPNRTLVLVQYECSVVVVAVELLLAFVDHGFRCQGIGQADSGSSKLLSEKGKKRQRYQYGDDRRAFCVKYRDYRMVVRCRKSRGIVSTEQGKQL